MVFITAITIKSIFDKAAKKELIDRINSLREDSAVQWGRMNVAQMMKHCAQWDEMALGIKKYKQAFLGKLFGRIALKNMMKEEPLKKNMPTVSSFKITEKVDFTEEKKKWLKLLDGYDNFSNDGFIHPFFGAMTKEETGYIMYKHADHHLQQFGG